jgi:hypothetical protein
MVDNVIAMRARGARSQVRRGIDVTHAQALEIGCQRGSVVEAEFPPELKSVRNEWSALITHARRILRAAYRARGEKLG